MTLVISLLASAGIAAVVSGSFTWYLKHIEYRNNYYREIVNRRLGVYELIDKKILYPLNLFAHERDVGVEKTARGSWIHEIFAYGQQRLEDFRKGLLEVLLQKIWITNNTSHLLDRLDLETRGIYSRAEGMKPSAFRKALIKYGLDCFQFYRDFHLDIEKSVKKDLASLHRVKQFLKEERTLGLFRGTNTTQSG